MKKWVLTKEKAGGILGKLVRGSGPRDDGVPCKLNNAKLSERTETGAMRKHRNVMNLSEAEIHSHVGFKLLEGSLKYHSIESLILAQDERWRRA